MKIPEKYNKVREESKGRNGFIGLSIGKPLFVRKKVMKAYIDFMSNHFEHSYLFIADLAKRHNLMALEGVSEDEALRRVNILSIDYQRMLSKILKDYPNVEIKTWKDFQSKEYFHNLNILNHAYQTHDEFNKDCKKFVIDFLNLPRNKGKVSNLEEAVSVSVNYLLEELALLLVMPLHIENVCEIYPGEHALHERLERKEFDFCKDMYMGKNRLFMEVFYED